MASPADKLAESLAVLKKLQDHGRVALRASDMGRTHRERRWQWCKTHQNC